MKATPQRPAKEFLQRANEAAEIGSFIIDLGVNSLRCSSNFAGFFGLQEVETQSLFGTLARIHREDAARVCESYQVAARGEDGGRVNVEFKVDQPDGGIRWLACRGRIEFRIDDEGKRPHRIAGVCFDITDRKKAEASLRENAELFQEIANVAPVLIWMSDTAKACTWFNKPWVDFTGRTMEEELGDGWTEGVHPEDHDRCLFTYNEAFDRREPFRMDYRLRRFDGAWRIVNDIGVPRYAGDGTFLGYIGSCLDVTDQRRAEHALRDSEERFRRIYEHAATGIAITDLEGRFLSCNPAYSSMTGYSEAELSELSLSVLVHPEDREANAAQANRLYSQEIQAFETINRYLSKDGRVLWVHKHVSLFQHLDGRPSKVLVLVTDLSELKRQEEHIRLLMREVNHRSKNILNIVRAVARQTIVASPEDFLERFTKRIEALSANQDLLVKNAWKGAELNELVHSQLAHFADSIGTRIAIEGPALFISAAAAQAIGMALHELAANAAKYGALASAGGKIAIDWKIGKASGTEAVFVMTWQEQATAPISQPSRAGFGWKVIGAMVETALGAEVSLDFPPSGLRWQLKCPAREVLAKNRPRPGSGIGR